MVKTKSIRELSGEDFWVFDCALDDLPKKIFLQQECIKGVYNRLGIEWSKVIFSDMCKFNIFVCVRRTVRRIDRRCFFYHGVGRLDDTSK